MTHGKGRKMTRTSRLLLGLLALLAAGSTAAQTTYPDKPIRMIVGFPSGGAPDAVARLLGQKLAEALGQPIVTDNVPGAGGNISSERLAKAAPDGYTLGLLVNGQLVINPSLYKLSHDPAKDFAPISQVTVTPNMLVVNNAVAVKNVRELVNLAKARPGELTYGSGGTGTGNHMAAELFKSVAGIDIRHIPYKGVLAVVPDLLGERVSMMFSPLPVVLPLVRDGRLRAIAVTSLKRSASAADVPTVAESGYPGFEVTIWYGLLAPAGTPSAIIRRLHLETVKALAQPDVRAKLAEQGLDAIGNSPDEFAAIIKSEIPLWAKVIKEAGIKAD
jgi:tripartite-type tricarboxylate transporter receptor subunit TctC